MRYPETVTDWGFDPEYPDHYDVPDMSNWPEILGHNNFRAVASGGFALGLFAIEGRDDRFDEWHEMLIDSFDVSTELYGADGSYDEGISYANYANTYLVYFMEVMKRKQDLELFDAINFVGMMDCNLALFLPHHLEPSGSVNFGDAGPSMNSSNLLWVAQKSRDGVTQYQALNHAGKHDLFSLLYFDPSVVPVPPDDSLHYSLLEFDWITTRTGYAMDDLVVSMRSGPPANHEHADRNSVILKYFGEILFADSKHPTYNAKSPGWLLRTSPAHNTILIDGKGHAYHNGEEGTNASAASAMIVRDGERPDYVFWTSDATEAYSVTNQDVQSITRTVLVFREIPFLIVLDKMTKASKPSLFSARWFVENSDKQGSVTTSENTFTLNRPHAKFFGAYGGSQPIQLESLQLPLDESIGVFPYADVATVEKSSDALFILAGAPLEADEDNPRISVRQMVDHWEIEVIKAHQYLKVHVFDRGEIPEFEVMEMR